MQNQGNTGNEGKFVDRVTKAIVELAILTKAQQGEVTKQNLQQIFKQGSFTQGNFATQFEPCLQKLTQEGHLKAQGDKYTITDDGREDIQKIQNVVLELPQLIQQGGNVGQQRPGMTAQRTTGGQTSGSNVGQSGGSMGSNPGSMGQSGSNVGGQNRNPR